MNSGTRTENFYDLLRGGKFVFDTDATGYDNLKMIIRKNADHKTYMERIQRWKSAVPSEETMDRSVKLANEKNMKNL